MKVGDDASPAKNSLEISYLFILTVLRTCVASKPFVEAGSVEWRTRVEDKDEDGHQNKKLPRATVVVQLQQSTAQAQAVWFVFLVNFS